MDFAAIVKERLDSLGWTPYRLAKEVDGVTVNTVYNLLAGKPVTSETLAAVFAPLNLIVVVDPRARKN